MYLRLSHTLNERDRAFPGSPTMKLTPFETIGVDQAACNTYRMEIFNHFGTHMDGPNHFVPDGKQLWELELDTFISHRPLMIDIPKGEGEAVFPEELMAYDEQIQQADMLFIRSGFEKMRKTDNLRYSSRGPCISARAAKLIIERWSNLKAVGMDWISLASPLQQEDGIRAHQIMLGLDGNPPVLIIEDISMEKVDAAKLEKVFVLPVFVEGVDSAPVTILAQIKEN